MDFEYTGSGSIAFSGKAIVHVTVISVKPVCSPFIVVIRLVEQFYYRLITRGKEQIKYTLLGRSV